MASLRAAINEHCKQCVYDKGAEGNWRQQVTAWQGYSCKLSEVRPVSKGEKIGVVVV
jgi:uncharacterized protein YjlB